MISFSLVLFLITPACSLCLHWYPARKPWPNNQHTVELILYTDGSVHHIVRRCSQGSKVIVVDELCHFCRSFYLRVAFAMIVNVIGNL
jgi:hypothetical protein